MHNSATLNSTAVQHGEHNVQQREASGRQRDTQYDTYPLCALQKQNALPEKCRPRKRQSSAVYFILKLNWALLDVNNLTWQTCRSLVGGGPFPFRATTDETTVVIHEGQLSICSTQNAILNTSKSLI